MADLNTGLIAYYPFNGTANDVTGNNNHGILHGGVTLTQDKLGHENSAYYFDGVSGYISVPNKAILNPTKQITIALWVRLDSSIGGWTPLIDKGGTGSSGCPASTTYSVWLTSSQFFQLYDGSGCSGTLESPLTKIPKGSWQFFVGIIDVAKSQKSVYLNGVLKGKKSISGGLVASSGEMRIGWTTETHSAYSYFNGAMDEIRLYNRVLSATEIQQLYQLNQPISGVVKGFSNVSVTCENLTRGTSVSIPSAINTWDCEKAGLSVMSGDTVKVTTQGKAR